MPDAPPNRFNNALRTVLFYAVVFAGFGLLVASVFVVFTHPLWLLLFVPLLGVWAIWLLNEYWAWVRKL
ncbi:MAG TPA: hypothetical protein VF796_18050 [Humisphaera sp.]